MRLYIPTIGQVERHNQDDHRTDDAHLHRVLPVDDMRDNISNHHYKAEGQGQQAADALPAGDNDQGKNKNSQQDKNGTRPDSIGVIHHDIVVVWA